MNWYVKVLKNFANFSGRARRKEYWMFALISFVISLILGFIDGAIHTTLVIGPGQPIGIIQSIYGLVVLIPGLAVGVRRLHDINKSGWMLLVALIPLVGAIWLLVLLATNGTPGENNYGPDPKAEEGSSNPIVS